MGCKQLAGVNAAKGNSHEQPWGHTHTGGGAAKSAQSKCGGDARSRNRRAASRAETRRALMAGGAETNFVMHHKEDGGAVGGANVKTRLEICVGTIEGGAGSVPDVRNPPL